MSIRNIYLFLFVCLFTSRESLSSTPEEIGIVLDEQTGAITRIYMPEDARNLNWLLDTNGLEHTWIGKDYGWGLGNFVQEKNGLKKPFSWRMPLEKSITDKKYMYSYVAGDILIHVSREFIDKDIVEEFILTNTGNETCFLSDISINTPFHDSYPKLAEKNTSDLNVSVFPGNHAAYVNIMNINGIAPHLGLVLLKGFIENYEVREQERPEDESTAWGVILLNPENITLEPGENYHLSWRLFSHTGIDDFYQKILDYGSVTGKSKKNIYRKGEEAEVEFISSTPLTAPVAKVNGKPASLNIFGKSMIVRYPVEEEGDMFFELYYNNGKKTFVQCQALALPEETGPDLISFRNQE